MRRACVLGLLLFAVALSCSKTKGPINGNSVQPNNNLDSTVSMSASINGAKWQTDSAFGNFIRPSANDSSIVELSITATEKSATGPTTMLLYISNFIGPATYTINPPVNTATYYIGNNRHYAIAGRIIVTSDSAYALKGTFSFITDTITVSNGVFNVALP